MPPYAAALQRLLADRSLRFGVALAVAAGFVCLVVAGRSGVFEDLVALALAPSIVLARRRPVLAVGIGLGVLAVSVARGALEPGSVENVSVYTVLVVPVLGARLDDRPRVRAAGLALAGAALVAVVLWAGLGTIGGSEALVLPSVLLLALPVALAAAWRRPEWRAALSRLVRDRLPDRLDTGAGFRTAVGAAVMLWLLCAALQVGSGDLGVLVAALPLAAALPFALSRPDLALGLSALGLLATGIAAFATQEFGAGDALAMLLAAVSVFGAALRGTVLQRRLAMGLVGGVAVACLALPYVGGFDALAVVVAGGVLPFTAAFAWRQWRTAGGLRVRLTESHARERAVERDVRLEQERTRIAREVHDVVAHSLAVVIAQADGARYAALADPRTVGPALEAIAETARDALGEVRTMLHDLRTSGDGAAAPGSADLPALTDGLRALGVEVREAVYGVPAPLDEQADQAVYRIVQEALTNALRHGRRDGAIDLELDWGGSAFAVVVKNALPDAPREAGERAGHGIPGMRERAALAGGECTAGVGSTGVFRVRATLPLAPHEAEDEAPRDARPDGAEADVLALLGVPAAARG